MKNFLLLAVAALSLGACSRDKPAAETAATNALPSATPNTAVVVPDTIAYRDEARHTADRVVQDLAVTDAAVKRRLENTYYTRASRVGEATTRYATDTTGRYAALRQANDQADEEVRTTLNNPAYYNTYSANRAQYGDGPYSLPPARLEPVRSTAASAGTPVARRVGQGSLVKKMERQSDGDKKTKFENGAKIKRNDDGSVKIKRADGTKVKIDEEGHRTVKKGLFH